MNKVKCTNNHFFNADKFSCCPICGASVSGTSEAKAPVANEVKVQSRLEPVDKTEIMEETPQTQAVTGKASGIKWHIFGAKHQTESARERRAHEEESKPEEKEPEEAKPEEKKPEVKKPEEPVVLCADPEEDFSKKVKPEPEVRKKESVASSLSQAVEATGHGITSALPKTVAYYDLPEVETEPPTAWLVCVRGIYQGQAFPCKSGRNRIGRNPNCNINLINDNTITREPHAMIIYDPKQRLFYLQNGSGDGLVYLNGELLFAHEKLNAYDNVQLGKAEFIFIPLCGERFAWEDYFS